MAKIGMDLGELFTLGSDMLREERARIVEMARNHALRSDSQDVRDAFEAFIAELTEDDHV